MTYENESCLSVCALRGGRGMAVLGMAVLGMAGLFLIGSAAEGQASSTASRNLGFSVFGGYSRVRPDYGPPGDGYAFGGEVNRHLRFFNPALEMRYSGFSQGIKENLLAGNLKLEKPLGRGERVTPYIGGGFGYGSFTFAGGNHDSSITKQLGGGVDVALVRHFGVKLDYEHSFWNFGGPGAVTLSPAAYTAGVVYRFDAASFGRHQ